MLSPILVVASWGGKKRTFLLTADQPVTIGRDAANSLADRDDDMLSKFHCVIEKKGDSYQIRDLKSLNGTKVNGKRIESAAIKRNDVIEAGRMVLKFKLRDIEPSLLRAATDRAHGVPPGAAPPTDESTTPQPIPTPPPRAPDSPSNDTTVAAEAIEPLDLEPADESDQPIRKAVRLHNVTGESAAAASPPDMFQGAMAHVQALQAMAGALPRQHFTAGDIRLYNARNQEVPLPGAVVEQGKEGVSVFRALLMLCFRSRATDLHIEPKGSDFEVRLRVDGMMAPVIHLQQAIGQRVLRVVKVLSHIDIAHTNIIQEGHFSSSAPDRRVDYRVSFTPSIFGQKLVIRILDLANAPQYTKDLQMTPWMARDLRQVVRQDAGMVLVCGPTGSGKTSTLYALMREIDRSARNVVTIEDPVEYQIDGVTQIPINAGQGNSFSSLLRSVLRQDPDVLMVGEIRDSETARIALQAAMTGHLVFSTVHARDTISAIFRLLDLGLEPPLIASSLHIVLGQRLVRLLCPYCKVYAKPSADHIIRFNRYSIGNVAQTCEPMGCARCLETGYIGRRGIFEMLVTTEKLRDVIVSSPQMQDIRVAIRSTVFTSLFTSGYQLVADGLTSVDEIERVMGIE